MCVSWGKTVCFVDIVVVITVRTAQNTFLRKEKSPSSPSSSSCSLILTQLCHATVLTEEKKTFLFSDFSTWTFGKCNDVT